MGKEKEKRKRRINLNQREFVSPQSPHNCTQLVQELDRRDEPRRLSFQRQVQYEPIDQDSYTFVVHRSELVVRGRFIKLEDGTTLVTCQHDLSLMLKLFFGFFALLGFASMALSLQLSLRVWVVWFILMLFFYIMGEGSLNEVENALLAEKGKRG